MIFISKSAGKYEGSDGVNGFELLLQQNNLRHQKPQKIIGKKYEFGAKLRNFQFICSQ